jgi:hypothetical protein
MCSKRNGATGVRGHRTMNLPVTVVGTELWALCESHRHHVLNILRPYNPQDVWLFKIPPNRHVILPLETVISRVFFGFFVIHTKNHATYFHSDKLDFKHNFFFKKKIVLQQNMLPSCRVIFPHPTCNIVMRAIPLEFVLCINNLFKIKIIIIY